MELWHVLNRGVDKRKTFMEPADYVRFIHDLYEFNDTAAAPEFNRRTHVGHPMSHIRKRLVDIHAWCLMRNHYHLLLSARVENGVSLFMKKLNMGYAKYFNQKYDRTGALWQGKHKKIFIERDAHFIYIPYYIHLNPLDYAFPQWRTGEVRDVSKALIYLSEYRWSSHLDYLGTKNFPSVIQPSFLSETFETPTHYKAEIRNIITRPNLGIDSARIE
ncbi:MAG TPA: transposase [Candidatus Paceibacterota bacterium]|nr:transposase [Candidatus Paceibacterota bacterium]